MIRNVFVLLAISAVAVLANTEVKRCGDTIDERYLPLEVRAPACVGGVCYISRNSHIQFEVDATVPYDTRSVMATGAMHYQLPYDLEHMIPFDFPEDVVDGCRGLVSGSACPLTAGEQFTWRLDWDWQPSEELEVGVTFEAEIRLFDENETVASCFRVPCIISE